MKSTDDSKLINRLIANELIYDLFSNIPNFIQLFSFVHFAILSFISIDGLVTVFDCLLATASCFLLALIASSAATFNSLSATVSYLLFVSKALSATMFNFLSAALSGIRVSCLYPGISQDTSATPNVCQIIQLVLVYLDLLTYTEPAEFLIILCKSVFKLQGFKAETIQFYLPPPLLLQ